MIDYIRLVGNCLNYPEGLEVIEQEIRLLFGYISQTENIEEADSMLKSLGDIQCVLAGAIFEEEVEVPSFIRAFIFDFDKVGSISIKKLQYQKIRLGHYSIN